jgi:hypothetical protein
VSIEGVKKGKNRGYLEGIERIRQNPICMLQKSTILANSS